MLEPPSLPEANILACLRAAYGLDAARLAFMPLGADQNTAVYRVEAASGPPHFLKLRSGDFDETSVLLPKYLKDQGLENVISPIPTAGNQLWAVLENFTVVLYPFVEGRDGFEANLTERQWHALGRTLRRLHSLPVPANLRSRLNVESYSPHWRESVLRQLRRAEAETFAEPISARLADFLRAAQAQITGLVEKTERYARSLPARSLESVLCHSDIHAGNILVDPDGGLHIVDWDNPILAPKERDLMFVGAGVGGVWNTDREAELFYRGYGPAQIDPAALAYYRCERIVEDIAAFVEEILSAGLSDADRERGLAFLMSNFEPGGTLELADRGERAGR